MSRLVLVLTAALLLWLSSSGGLAQTLCDLAETYWTRYPDVAASGAFGRSVGCQGAWNHFQQYGQFEGRIWSLPALPAPSGPAATFVVAEQFALPTGFSQRVGCGFPNGRACVALPAGWWLQAFTLTSTVKAPGIEILSLLKIDGLVLWQGEHFQGTIPVTVMLPKALQLGESPKAWIEFEAINPGSFADGIYELQATLYLTNTP